MIVNEYVRIVMFTSPAAWLVFYNKVSCKQLGLIGIHTKGIQGAVTISILYVIIAICFAKFVENKTFKISSSYLF